jgi:hypothetical protein
LPPGFLVQIGYAAAASAAVLLATWPWRERGWPVPVALGLGVAATHVAAKGLPDPWPVDATDLLFHFALLGAALGAAQAAVRVPRPARAGGRLLVSLACAWALFRTIDGPARIGLLGLGFFAAWSALEWRAAGVEGPGAPACLVPVAGAGGAALALANTATLAQAAGAIAAAAAPLLGYALLRPRLALARGGVTAYSLVSLPLWACGVRLADLPLESAALLAIAPLAAQRRWWLGALVAAAAAGFAVYLSYAANPIDPNDPYAGYR